MASRPETVDVEVISGRTEGDDPDNAIDLAEN